MASLQLGEGATTVHHWSGIGDGRLGVDELNELFLHDDRYVEAKTRVLDSHILVIDEIGMLSRHMFELLESICRRVRHSPLLFGGLQVIACGDFKQLPPVPNHLLGDDGSYCFMSELFLKAVPHHKNLTKVVRQSEMDLVTAVNELCNGSHSEETQQLMVSLERPLQLKTDDILTVIMGSNFDVNYYNQEQLHGMEGTQRTYHAIDGGDKSLLRRSAAQRILTLKVGAPVILIRNLSHSLVNGTRGVVHDLRGVTEDPIINFSGKLHHVQRVSSDVFDLQQQRTLSVRTQYPINLAFALTVHRAQGMTLDNVVVNCSSIFTAGQIGVSVGRAKVKSGLQVLNYNQTVGSLKHSKEVYEIYNMESCPPDDEHKCCSSEVSDSKEMTSAFSFFTKQSQTSFDFSTIPSSSSQSGQATCPFSIKDFLDVEKDSPFMACAAPDYLDLADLKTHVDVQYRTLQAIHKKCTKKSAESKCDWTGLFKDINSYLLSDCHIETIKKLFKVESVNKDQNKFSSKTFLWINTKIIETESEKNIKPSVPSSSRHIQVETLLLHWRGYVI